MAMEAFEKIVRSLLVSIKEGLSARDLAKEYHELKTKPIPLAELGFTNIHELFASMEGRVIRKTGRVNRFREPLYLATFDEKVDHIRKNVSEQKTSKGGKTLGGIKAGPQRQRPKSATFGMSANIPPAISANRARGRGRGAGRGGLTHPTFRHDGRGTRMQKPPERVAAPFMGGRGAGPFSQPSPFWNTGNGGFVPGSDASFGRPAPAARFRQYARDDSSSWGGPSAFVPYGLAESNSANLAAPRNTDASPAPRFAQYSRGNSPPWAGIAASDDYAFGVQQTERERPVLNPYSTGNRMSSAPDFTSVARIPSQIQMDDSAASLSLADKPKSVAVKEKRNMPEPAPPPEKPVASTSVVRDSKRRLPCSIKQFADEVQAILVNRYPNSVLVTDLGKAYNEEYGDDFDVDTQKYYCKTWVQLVTGLLQKFCEVEGEGLKMKVKCKTAVARKILEKPLEETSKPPHPSNKETIGQEDRRKTGARGEGDSGEEKAAPVAQASSEKKSQRERKERLKKICKTLLGSSSVRLDVLISRIKALENGKDLLEDMNIWGPVDLIVILPDLQLDFENGLIKCKSQPTTSNDERVKAFDERVKAAYEFALTMPNRRIPGKTLQEYFGISKVDVSKVLSSYKGLFSLKYSNSAALELEATLPVPDVGKATVHQSYELETFHVSEMGSRYVHVGLCDKCSANPSLFHVKLLDNMDQLDSLLGRMRKFYSEMDELKHRIYTIPSAEIQPGLPCAFLTVTQGEFMCCRVVVTDSETRSDMVEVKFVDHGTVGTINTQCLRYIPLDFVEAMKGQAIPCGLAELEEWSDESKTELVRFFETSPGAVWAYVGDFLEGKYMVELCQVSQDGSEDRFLGDELIATGLARGNQEAAADDHPGDIGSVDTPSEVVESTTIAVSNISPVEESLWDEEEEDEIEKELEAALSLKDEVSSTAPVVNGDNAGIGLGPPPGLEAREEYCIMNSIRILEAEKQKIQEKVALGNCRASEVLDMLNEAAKLDDDIKRLRSSLPPSDPRMS